MYNTSKLCVSVDGWQKRVHQFTKLEHGKWSLTLQPHPDGRCVIDHNSILKVRFLLLQFSSAILLKISK